MIDVLFERKDGTMTVSIPSLSPELYQLLQAGDVVYQSDDYTFSIHPYGENSLYRVDFGCTDLFIDMKRGFTPVSFNIVGYTDEDYDILENRINEVLRGNPVR